MGAVDELLVKFDEWEDDREIVSEADEGWEDSDDTAVDLLRELAEAVRAALPAPITNAVVRPTGPSITCAPDGGGWDAFHAVVEKALIGWTVRVTNPGQAPVELLVGEVQRTSVAGTTYDAKAGEWVGPRIVLELDDDVLIEVF